MSAHGAASSTPIRDAKNLSIDARPGGCFCETSNGGVEHMRVVFVRRNQSLRMFGSLGPLLGSGGAGSMAWRLSPADNAAKLCNAFVSIALTGPNPMTVD